MNTKHRLRRMLIERRLDTSSQRRLEVKEQILHELLPRLEPFSLILSFASKEEEIDLWPLNAQLAKEKRLLLPKVMPRKRLSPFKVCNLSLDLEETRWRVKEPVITRCEEIPIEKVSCVLVPGLGFDQKKHRIGYGIGYYDRFLQKMGVPLYGIGFKEQFLRDLIPIESHDVPLTDVFLF